MLLSQALDAVLRFSPKEFTALADLLSPELIDECLANTGVVTLRKRRLPMEMMVWAITGMSLFCSLSMNQLVSHLDIVLPGKRLFVAPSAVVQARQRLGENDAVFGGKWKEAPATLTARLISKGISRAVKKKPQRYPQRPS